MIVLANQSLKIIIIINYKIIMTHERLDIVQLIENNPLEKLSNHYQTQLLDRIKETFDDSDQQLFIASFYCYLKYDCKKDFIINMDDVWKWLGFSRRDPCKRVIEKHFTLDVDYKILLHQIVEQVHGGHNKEKIVMNVETFKSLCLLANTERSKSVRKYYYKLEQLLHELLEEQAEELQKQIEENKQKLIEQQKRIDLLEHKPNTHGFNSRRAGYVYMINDKSKPGHYKIGMSYDVDKRLSKLNTASSEATLEVFHEVKTYDCETLENTVHKILQPFNIPRRREWFFFSNDTELQYALYVLYETQVFLNKFNFKSYDEVSKYVINNVNNKHKKLNEQESSSALETKESRSALETKESSSTLETNIYKLTGQQLSNKTGQYKGVFWCTEKSKWRAALKIHYKECFLGYFDTELQGAIVYNDYALFLNSTRKTSYAINDIPEYTPNPRDIVKENLENVMENKTSSYQGVSYDINRKCFVVSIKYKKKSYHLGYNIDELECAKLYNQQALYFNTQYNTNYELNNIPDYITIPKNIHDEIQSIKINKKSSKYYGVTFCKSKNKFRSVLVYNKKQIHLGFFENELDAARSYNIRAHQLNEQHTCNYKLNII
jgi:phage anti-repressor protein